MEGCYNLRDIGGYTTTDGRLTRWGTLLRADGLHNLTPASQEKLLGYAIRTIIDLRRPAELEAAPNVFAKSPVLTYLNISLIEDEGLAHTLPGLVEIYKDMLDNSQAQFKLIFDTMLLPDSFPVLVHCAAGKDRTGLVIALLLGLANVPAETITADYALSAECLNPLFSRFREQFKGASPDADMRNYEKLLASEPEMMLETLEYLDVKYGGAYQYLTNLGFDSAQLNELRNKLIQ